MNKPCNFKVTKCEHFLIFNHCRYLLFAAVRVLRCKAFARTHQQQKRRTNFPQGNSTTEIRRDANMRMQLTLIKYGQVNNKKKQVNVVGEFLHIIVTWKEKMVHFPVLVSEGNFRD